MGKNLQKVQDMLDGNYKTKIQVGQYAPTEETRKVGDKWVDSDGNHWEQKEGYRTKNTNNKFLFSYSGSLKLINIPNNNPKIKYKIVLISVFSILLIKMYSEPIIKPKKT